MTHVYVREDGYEARRIEITAAQMRRLLYEVYAWREMAASLLGCGTAPLEADYRAHVRGGMTGDEARAAVIAAHFVVRPSLVDRILGGWR